MLESRTVRRTLCLAAAATLGLAATPSLAGETTHAAATVCSGRGLKKVDGALVNANRGRTRTATCFMQTLDQSNDIGADLYWVVTKASKGSIHCVGSSYDQSNRLVESVVGPVIDTVGIAQRELSLTTSDGSGSWAGYYKLVCSIPAKARLHTVGLEENVAP